MAVKQPDQNTPQAQPSSKAIPNDGTLRLLVVDTWSNENVGIIADIFPNATFKNIPTPYRVSERCHSHGINVAYCALSQISKEKKVEVSFYRVFDHNGHPYKKFESWIEAMADYKPHATVCSFGTHHGNSSKQIQMLNRIYGKRYQDYLCKKINESGGVVFGASGNEDSSNGRVDFDNDVGYPWRTANCGNLAIIGAVDSENKPATFSSDGSQVDSAWFGQDVPVVMPDGKKIRISGTSFATPICAGYYLDRGFKNFEQFDAHCFKKAYRAEGWDYKLKHPKVGWGSMHPWERPMASADTAPSLSEWQSAI